MGGVIVVWEANPVGDWNLYAERVSASGNAVWAGGLVDVCYAADDQQFPAIVPDGAGGAFIAWQDGRSGNDDIYIQHLNASGSARWTANGVAVCAATGSQTGPRMIPDGGGGVIVVWQDNRASGYDVYAQRVNVAGTALWTADGVAVCTAAREPVFLRAGLRRHGRGLRRVGGRAQRQLRYIRSAGESRRNHGLDGEWRDALHGDRRPVRPRYRRGRRGRRDRRVDG